MRNVNGIVLIAIFCAPSAHAFDPFTAMMAAGAVVNGAKSLFGAASELSDTVDSFQELYSEVNSDGELSESGKRIIEEVESIERLYREEGYAEADLGTVGSQLTDARKLSETIKGITHAIRAVKNAKAILKGPMERRAQRAAVESASIQREQLIVETEILNQQKLIELREIKKDLKENIKRRESVRQMHLDLQKKGATVLGATGILAFPKTESLVEDGLVVAEKIRPYLLGLVLGVFLMRLVFYQFSFRGMKDYGDLLRDTLVCFVILAAFPEIVRACSSITSELASHMKVSGAPFYSVDRFWADNSTKENGRIVMKDPGTKADLLMFAQLCWEGVRYISYVVAGFIFKYVIVLMVVVTPFVIFMSEMFNFPIGWKVFFLAFVTINTWPILWNMFGMLVDRVAQNQSGFSGMIETALSMTIQFISPLIAYSITKTGSGGALSSISGAHAPASVVKNVVKAGAMGV